MSQACRSAIGGMLQQVFTCQTPCLISDSQLQQEQAPLHMQEPHLAHTAPQKVCTVTAKGVAPRKRFLAVKFSMAHRPDIANAKLCFLNLLAYSPEDPNKKYGSCLGFVLSASLLQVNYFSFSRNSHHNKRAPFQFMYMYSCFSPTATPAQKRNIWETA